jgi:GNAT superfamily N-acetyltransferase
MDGKPLVSQPLADFEIRPATEVDAPAVLSLIQQLAAYEKLSDEVVATEASLRETLFGDAPAAEIALACWKHEPVGFVLFFRNYSTFLGRPGLYIEDLFVREQFRGRGFGGALFEYVGRLAGERRCGRVEWAVLDWNSPAIEFYRRRGAVPMTGWTVYRLAGESLKRFSP